MVPSDNYNAYEICYRRSVFLSKDYNVMVDCDLNGIPVDTFCRDMEVIKYNITISLSALLTSPKELVIICGYSLTDGVDRTLDIKVNGIFERKAIIKGLFTTILS